jgi:O-antigen/teichoic acid export membrane protein
MQKPYTFNYLKIYLWQGISIVLNLLSMFIVIPRLADNPSLYGIYVISISANIFLTYADLGFVNAGYKYASESFAQKNLEEEIRIVGFIGFVLAVFVVFFALAFSGIALNPGILVKNLKNMDELNTASSLLLILAAFSPVIIFQRLLEIVYGIRLEQFIFQRIMIAASLVKILSVFYFFQNTRYEIVGYFLFCQLMNLVAVLVSLLIVKFRYEYSLSFLFQQFRFSKPVFEKTKSLAFGSLFITITWILYYEIDAFVIAKILGSVNVAIYAVGFTIVSFLRTIFGVFYMPFSVRFNHFVGLNDLDGLRNMYSSIVILTLPFVLFPTTGLVLMMQPFVNCWVGSRYDESVFVAQLLILGFIYGFFTYPASFLVIAQEKMKMLYLTSAILPVIYWTGIALTVSYLGLISFALFKFIALTVNGIIYFIITLNFLNMSLGAFIRKILSPVAVPLTFLFLMLLYLNQFMPLEKNKINLIIVVATVGLVSAGSFFLYYLFSGHFRNYTQALLRKVFA